MKFTLPVTFDIDPATWKEEYDCDSISAAVEDIIGALNRAVTEGALADVIVSQWPMMRDAAKVTVGPPAMQRTGDAYRVSIAEARQRFNDGRDLIVSKQGHLPTLAVTADMRRYNNTNTTWPALEEQVRIARQREQGLWQVRFFVIGETPPS